MPYDIYNSLIDYRYTCSIGQSNAVVVLKHQVPAYFLDPDSLFNSKAFILNRHIITYFEQAYITIVWSCIKEIFSVEIKYILSLSLCTWLKFIIPLIPEIFFCILLVRFRQIYICYLICVSLRNPISLTICCRYS